MRMSQRTVERNEGVSAGHEGLNWTGWRDREGLGRGINGEAS